MKCFHIILALCLILTAGEVMRRIRGLGLNFDPQRIDNPYSPYGGELCGEVK